MAHSVELLFDPATEATIHASWDELREAGIRSQPSASRPHVTLTVAERIDPEVDEFLSSLANRFPFPCRIGAPLLFGRSQQILTRLVVPTTELLDLHAEVYRTCLPYLRPGPMTHALPGQWTAHVTLARRVVADQLGAAVHIAAKSPDVVGAFVGLRRWDGNEKREYPIT
jgi:2'-5' RNA ligase